jgi:hypothetical protein
MLGEGTNLNYIGAVFKKKIKVVVTTSEMGWFFYFNHTRKTLQRTLGSARNAKPAMVAGLKIIVAEREGFEPPEV